MVGKQVLNDAQSTAWNKHVDLNKTWWGKKLAGLDVYASENTRSDPTKQDQSFVGGCLTLIFYSIFLLLLIYGLIQFFSARKEIVRLDQVDFNYVPNGVGEGDTVNFLTLSELKEDYLRLTEKGEKREATERAKQVGRFGQLDYPAFDVHINQRITFYQDQASAPSLQRVDLVDQKGISPTFRSSNRNVPITKSAYGKAPVPFNSFDTTTAYIPSPNLEVTKTVDTIVDDSVLHEFTESLRSLTVLAEQEGSAAAFYPHSTYLYLRFPDGELSQIMTCQMQVQLMNVAEFNVLSSLSKDFNDRSYLRNLTTLQTTDATWSRDLVINEDDLQDNSFLEDNDVIDFFTLTSAMNQQTYDQLAANNPGMEPSSYTDWRFAFSYVNNFAASLTNYTCRSSPIQPNFIRAQAPSDTDLQLNLTGTIDFGLPVPFAVLVSSEYQSEVMTVTAVNGDRLTVTRSNPLEFRPDFYLADFYANIRNEYPDPPYSWTCPKIFYSGTSQICDCGCGFVDPDCEPGQFTKSFGCADGYVCGLEGTCVPDTTATADTVWVSDACRFDILAPGTSVPVGYVAQDDTLPQQCRECETDPLYDYEAVFIDGGTVCNADVYGTIVSLELSGSTATADVIFGDGSAFLPVNKQFKLALGVGTDVEGVVTANVTKTNLFEADQRLVFDLNDITPQSGITYFFEGEVISSVQPGTTSIVVHIPDPDLIFTNDVDFVVMYRGLKSPLVAPVSDVECPNAQTCVLALSSPASGAFGSYWRVRTATAPGSTQLFVDPVGVKASPFISADPVNGTGGILRPVLTPEFPVRIAVDFYDIEYNSSDRDTYNGNDGCHCGFNAYDPDCARPSVAAFAGPMYCGGTYVGDCRYNATVGDVVCPRYCDPDGNVCRVTKPVATEPPAKFPFVLNLTQPLDIATGVGDTVEIGLTTVYDYPYIRSNFAISLFRGENNTSPEYFAEDRWKTPPRVNPTQLDAEFAVFVIPDRDTYSTLDLCLKEVSAKPPAPPEDFKFRSNGNNNRVKCQPGFTQPKGNCKAAQPGIDIYTQCIDEMPPVREFEFDVKLPVNHRWKKYTVSDVSRDPDSPEFTVRSTLVYHFSHDQRADDVDTEFSNNAAPSGDLTPEYQRPKFTGPLIYKGVGKGNKTVPANSPKARTKISIEANEELTRQIVELFEPSGWPSNLDRFDVNEQFGITPIEFELDTVGGQGNNLFLSPGYAYSLTALVTTAPVYTQSKGDPFGGKSIKAWNTQVTSTRTDVTPLPYDSRSQATLTIQVTFNPNAIQALEQSVYGISDLISGWGSAFAYTGFGFIVLKIYFACIVEQQVDNKSVQMENAEKAEKFAFRPDSEHLPRSEQSAVDYTHFDDDI